MPRDSRSTTRLAATAALIAAALATVPQLASAIQNDPDGTPGQCNVIQTGLFMTHFKGATADGFPAERVDLRQAGGGPLSLRPAAPSAPTATLPHATWGRLKTLYR
jgi:hypothetical protein